MSSIQDSVTKKVWDELPWIKGCDDELTDDIIVIAITTFLRAAAKEGWHMRPDEATYKMIVEADRLRAPNAFMEDRYRAMLAAAEPFKWRDE